MRSRTLWRHLAYGQFVANLVKLQQSFKVVFMPVDELTQMKTLTTQDLQL